MQLLLLLLQGRACPKWLEMRPATLPFITVKMSPRNSRGILSNPMELQPN